MVLKDIELNGKKFQLHERLKQKLDNIKLVQQSGWDCTLLIDGIEYDADDDGVVTESEKLPIHFGRLTR